MRFLFGTTNENGTSQLDITAMCDKQVLTTLDKYLNYA